MGAVLLAAILVLAFAGVVGWLLSNEMLYGTALPNHAAQKAAKLGALIEEHNGELEHLDAQIAARRRQLRDQGHFRA